MVIKVGSFMLSMLVSDRCIDRRTLGEYVESECEEIGNTLDFYMLYERRASASLVVAQTFDVN